MDRTGLCERNCSCVVKILVSLLWSYGFELALVEHNDILDQWEITNWENHVYQVDVPSQKYGSQINN